MELVQGLITLTAIHFFATASPGPDFVLISKQALSNGRKAAFISLAGTACGAAIHLTYSAFGLASVIADSQTALWVIKVLGGGYLIYLGIKGLGAQPDKVSTDIDVKVSEPSRLKTFKGGFICDVFNPKAPVYYVSLFTLVLSPQMSGGEIFVYGVWMATIHVMWFSCVILLLSTPSMNRRYKKISHWFDRVFGASMMVLGGKIILSK
jgi:RhtB (resistance to homoserine/threonine) family protein